MAQQPKQYTGSVYVGVVGSEFEIGECHDSIDGIVMRPGDEGPNYVRATKGYEARQMHINSFLASRHAFLLLLDSDMVFSADTLERLRGHKRPYVSGYYMRRRYNPIAPVWFSLPPRRTFPMDPWLSDPERGKLHPLGASGWGCILIHREVIEQTRPLLKGEWEVSEDDMDVWPYDLGAVMGAITGLEWLEQTGAPDLPSLQAAMRPFVDTLKRELRPLRADKKEIVGSDIRYPFFAREAGYTLMGDPDVRPRHMLNYPISPDDFGGQPEEYLQGVKKQTHAGVLRDRARLRRGVQALGGGA